MWLNPPRHCPLFLTLLLWFRWLTAQAHSETLLRRELLQKMIWKINCFRMEAAIVVQLSFYLVAGWGALTSLGKRFSKIKMPQYIWLKWSFCSKARSACDFGALNAISAYSISIFYWNQNIFIFFAQSFTLQIKCNRDKISAWMVCDLRAAHMRRRRTYTSHSSQLFMKVQHHSGLWCFRKSKCSSHWFGDLSGK